MRVALIGGAASGVTVAAQLLRRLGAGDEVVIVEPAGEVGLGVGVAYGTRSPVHRLNVPAKGMSAYPDDARHYLRFLERRAEIDKDTFVPRREYGAYLRDLLEEAAAASDAELRFRTATVVDVTPAGEGLALALEDGSTLEADRAVLAVGHGRTTGSGWAGPSVVAEPFTVDWEERLERENLADRTAVVVGTGLTAVDVVLELARAGFRDIVAVSNRGRFPEAQPDHPEEPASGPTIERIAAARTPGEFVSASLAAGRAAGSNWRAVIDAMRPLVPKLWARLSDADADRLAAHGALYWELLRNRMPPQSGRDLAALTEAGTLRVLAGRVVDIEGSVVSIRTPHGGVDTLDAGVTVLCTGPSKDPHEVGDGLIGRLLASGVAQPGRLGIGIAVREGRVTGLVEDRLWAVGPLRVGDQWESTSMSNIRVQAVDAAEAIAGASV